MKHLLARYIRVALPFVGSAILLFSCGQHEAGDSSASDESVMTEYSENLTVLMSQNGRRSYHFVTPLLEGYSMAKEPYREFRRGVKITTYKDDSLSTVDAILTANYAIYYETRQLWEAKGNVVVEKSDGKTLYTQQLFWNQKTKKIYSNVDSKIVQSGGRDVFVGEGFESDEEFKDWRFRRMSGRMEVEVSPSDRADSVAGANPAAERKPVPEGAATSQKPQNEGAVPDSGAGTPARRPAADRHGGTSRRRPAGVPGRNMDPKSGERPAVQPRQIEQTVPAAPRQAAGRPDEIPDPKKL